MSKLNWNYKEVKQGATEEVGFSTIEAKPYICKILGYEDREEKKSLKIFFDITDGELKDYFKKNNKKFGGDWDLKAIKYVSYTEKSKYFFAAFVTAVEKSNDGFEFNPDKDWASQFKNKLVVVNYGLQEYISNDMDDNGKYIVRTSIMPQEFRSISALKEGKIKPLKLKKLTQNDFDYNKVTEDQIVYEDEAVNNETQDVNTGNFNDVEDDLPF